MTKNNIVLQATVGSTAYGLAHANSDVDTLGVFVAPIDDLLGLNWNNHKETIVKHDPDSTHHEIGKFIRLGLQCNPTILELLWMPQYTIKTELSGRLLVENRKHFLSRDYVKNAYGGYAFNQLYKLQHRGDFGSELKNRTEKNGRHCVRLIMQGLELLTTGQITVHLGDQVEQVRELGRLAATDVDAFADYFESQKLALQYAYDNTVLPEKPNTELINKILLTIRHHYV